MIARLIIRQAAGELAARHHARALEHHPRGAAHRAPPAASGRRWGESPATPSLPKSRGGARLQIRLSWICAPLLGSHARQTRRWAPRVSSCSSPIAAPSCTCACAPDEARPTTAPSNTGGGWPRPMVLAASITERDGLGAARSSSVRLEPSTEYAPTDAWRDTTCAEVGGPFDTVEGVDLHPFPGPDVPAQADAADVEHDTSASKFACRNWSRLPMSCQWARARAP